jgi:hypothetical protein
MHDLSDVTFTIPLRIDSKDRLENIQFIIEYLNKNFRTNIMVWEEGPKKTVDFDCEHIFKQSNDPVFHRTRILNEMCKRSMTDIIANYDTDVVFPVFNYVEAVEMIRGGGFDGVYPYAGPFCDVSRKSIQNIRTNNDPTRELVIQVLNSLSLGGCIFWNRDKFIEGGMENENFISWGYEDNERAYRFQTLGCNLGRTSGNLYHFTHQRGHNSDASNKYIAQNRQELAKVKAMGQWELMDYIKTWTWL